MKTIIDDWQSVSKTREESTPYKTYRSVRQAEIMTSRHCRHNVCLLKTHGKSGRRKYQFYAEYFNKTQSTDCIWQEILRLSIYNYMGPTDFLVVDQEEEYTTNEMKPALESHGIWMEEAPFENRGKICMKEWYHHPLRPTYNKIRDNIYITQHQMTPD